MRLFWQVCTLTGHSGAVHSVAFSATVDKNEKRLVSGCNSLVKIWDAKIEPEVRFFSRECRVLRWVFCWRFAQAWFWNMV